MDRVDASKMPQMLASREQESGTWTSVLFEPTDIVEVRCLPPKHATDSLNRYKFSVYGPANSTTSTLGSRLVNLLLWSNVLLG
jgi:hypothetical protein